MSTYVPSKEHLRTLLFKCSDFDVTDKNSPEQAKKFADAELQELLVELGVSRFVVGKRSKAMGEILKERKMFAHQISSCSGRWHTCLLSNKNG